MTIYVCTYIPNPINKEHENIIWFFPYETQSVDNNHGLDLIDQIADMVLLWQTADAITKKSPTADVWVQWTDPRSQYPQ